MDHEFSFGVTLSSGVTLSLGWMTLAAEAVSSGLVSGKGWLRHGWFREHLPSSEKVSGKSL